MLNAVVGLTPRTSVRRRQRQHQQQEQQPWRGRLLGPAATRQMSPLPRVFRSGNVKVATFISGGLKFCGMTFSGRASVGGTLFAFVWSNVLHIESSLSQSDYSSVKRQTMEINVSRSACFIYRKQTRAKITSRTAANFRENITNQRKFYGKSELHFQRLPSAEVKVRVFLAHWRHATSARRQCVTSRFGRRICLLVRRVPIECLHVTESADEPLTRVHRANSQPRQHLNSVRIEYVFKSNISHWIACNRYMLGSRFHIK